MAGYEKKPVKNAFEAFDRGLKESERRNKGKFDGLMGDFQGEHSELLRDICLYLRDHLLDRCSQDDVRDLVRLKRPPKWNESPEELARALLKEYSPRDGWVTPVPEDVEFALGLVNMIASALRVEPERRDLLILGKAGKRDKKRQEGAAKGSSQSAQQRKEQAWNEWGRRCVNDAKSLLATGSHERHELAGILARKYDKNERTIRNLLKERLDTENKKTE